MQGFGSSRAASPPLANPCRPGDALAQTDLSVTQALEPDAGVAHKCHL